MNYRPAHMDLVCGHGSGSAYIYIYIYETVSLFSSGPPCKYDNAQLTTVFLNPDQNCHF